MKTSKPVSLLLSVLTALMVLSASVAVPLLCRPFYYAHIGPMGLAEYTGLTEGQIQQAYDQVMDFCLGLRPDFAAGVLPWSESGASHFADVRGLFLLDLWVLGLSLAALLAVFLYCRVRRIRPYCFRGYGPGLWAAVGLGGTFLGIGGLAALNFDRAFVVFHALFFPGKDNWMFDWRMDPVILILPEDFFRNCAILILALLLLWCGVLILADLWARKRREASGEPPAPPCKGRSGRQR